jgi:hypothetical protein
MTAADAGLGADTNAPAREASSTLLPDGLKRKPPFAHLHLNAATDSETGILQPASAQA